MKSTDSYDAKPEHAEDGVEYQFDAVGPAHCLRLDVLFPENDLGAHDHVLVWGATPAPGSAAARWAVDACRHVYGDAPESLFRVYAHLEPLDGSASYAVPWPELEHLTHDYDDWHARLIAPPDAVEILEERERILSRRRTYEQRNEQLAADVHSWMEGDDAEVRQIVKRAQRKYELSRSQVYRVLEDKGVSLTSRSAPDR